MTLIDLPSWQALRAHRARWDALRLGDVCRADPDRMGQFTVRVGGLTADFSRNHISEKTVALFEAFAAAQNLEKERDAMFGGAISNPSEGRAVLHTALRAPKGTPPLCVKGRDVRQDIAAAQDKMRVFAEAVRQGSWRGATGAAIKTVVNIGIGGSDLGPRLVVQALRDFGGPLDVRFLANVDPCAAADLLADLDPATTLFVVVSKTFTTLETLTNARAARRWIVSSLGEDAPARHFVAVSTNKDAVCAFGIAKENMFPMWDWVGGRYSVWSAVGLSVVLAVGWEAFSQFLAGAAAMDAHFRTAPLAQNMPFLLGIVGIWYRNFWGSGAHAILPYTERLREMPRYLQQLEMESNGKRVTRAGESVSVPTAPALFGECGTVGQHSFHQWLHQGTDVTPVDFIGVRDAAGRDEAAHRALLANMVAQSDALLFGAPNADPARVNPGNRPSTLLWLEKLDPSTLGTLLALYEHKTFTQGILWGLNSFDQFGVELGKVLAQEALRAGP